MKRTVYPYPLDYCTAQELADELGVTLGDIEVAVRRRYPEPPYPGQPNPPVEAGTLIPGELADFVRQEVTQ